MLLGNGNVPGFLLTSENVPVSLFSSVDLPTDGKPAPEAEACLYEVL